jgi:hypothetical protein
MCQITAPPAVFLAGPLQAPGGWLLSVGVLAAVVALVPYTYRERMRQDPSAMYRRVGGALLGGGWLALCMGVVLLVLVAIPSRDALAAWYQRPYVTTDPSYCAFASNTALYDTEFRLSGAIDPWQLVAYVLLFGGFVIEIIWWSWSNRHLPAEPVRQ